MVRGFRICSNNKDILDARSATKAPRFLLREENMADAEKLSSMDASFLYLETPEMPMHVGSMAIFRLPDDYKGDFFEDFKAMIASSRAFGSSILVEIEQIMPNTWLLASVLPSSRSEIGTAAVIDLAGRAPRSSR